MALIKCPECGREISDKSKECIHCGYPIRNISYETVNGIDYDVSFLKDMNITKIDKIKMIKELINCDLRMAKEIVDKYCPAEIRRDNIPKCPTCLSTNIKKISGTSKVTSVALWGIFSQKVKKTYHCNNCGYEW